MFNSLIIHAGPGRMGTFCADCPFFALAEWKLPIVVPACEEKTGL
jgi:hypothetical protein